MPFLVYVIALVIGAGTLALSVDLATKPDIEPVKQQVAASAPVRQIPITKQSDISRGDPNNQLSPVYPAAPGKDLPQPAGVADATAAGKPADATANIGATAQASATAAATTGTAPATAAPSVNAAAPTNANVAPANVASTSGSASSDDDDEPRAQLASTGSATANAPNSCAVNACSSAYRSFRASDCTYQPFGGPRKVCDLNAGGMQNASMAPAPTQSRQPEYMPSRQDYAPRNRMRSRLDELDEVERAVRRLPHPDAYADSRGRRVIVIERPGGRYAPGVVYEEW